jgi:hypothetical protein
MRRIGWWLTMGAVLVLAMAGIDCDSTTQSNDCIKCTCQCSGSGGVTVSTTFEKRDDTGALLEVDCTIEDDCKTECAKVGAPTPVSATCVEYE